MSSGWIVQGRVIMALILREVHTLYGSSRLGYLWAVIQTMFGIGIFWGIREIAGARAPHGMSVLMFLLAGFGHLGHIQRNAYQMYECGQRQQGAFNLSAGNAA